jgi:hypothetical protein
MVTCTMMSESGVDEDELKSSMKERRSVCKKGLQRRPASCTCLHGRAKYLARQHIPRVPSGLFSSGAIGAAICGVILIRRIAFLGPSNPCSSSATPQ